VDPLLQPPSAPPGPRHENPRYGVCFSGLTCAENGGSLQPFAARGVAGFMVIAYKFKGAAS